VFKPSLSIQDVNFLAQNGPPMAMQAVGRMFGLGPRERAALSGDSFGLPGWTWGLLGIGIGMVVGIRIYRRWPGNVPTIVKGR